jgi:hypothetical protein
MTRVVRWRSWSGSGLEHLVLFDRGGYTEAQAMVISDAGPAAPDGFAATYSVRVDSDWRTLEVRACVLGRAGPLHLRRLNSGEWLGEGDTRLRELDRALDVDLSITPFTNTLPIRRLQLAIGESAEITAAYIEFPQLRISAEPQRYTRLASDRYRYESIDSGFVREITVDEHGLVTVYPDLFRRV